METKDWHLPQSIIDRLEFIHLPKQKSGLSELYNARIFRYPHLDNVFIMECDLQGKPFESENCGIGFYGKQGFTQGVVSWNTLLFDDIPYLNYLIEGMVNDTFK